MTRDSIADYARRMYVGPNMIVDRGGRFRLRAGRVRRCAKMFGAVPAGTAYAWAKDVKPAARRAAAADR